MRIEPITDEELKEEWLKTAGISRAINLVAQKVNEIIEYINSKDNQLL